MKRILLITTVLLLMTNFVVAAPDTSISIPNSFSPKTIISSSNTNSNNNEIATKYNTHSHADIAALGTVSTGFWAATPVTELYGGTGQSSYTIGDMIYASAANVLSKLAKGSQYNAMVMGGSNIPTWGQVNLASTAAVTGTLAVGNGGTGATAAANAANGVVVLDASAYLPDASCDTSALKTTTGEVSEYRGGSSGSKARICEPHTASASYITTIGLGFADDNFVISTLPGGTYGFYPQIKFASNTTYAQQRYVTASGLDLWVYLLIDKNTKEIIGAYQAPDHPAYGNGGDFDKLPHPFGSYDVTKHEIVLIDKETCLTLKQESQDTGKSILTLVNEDYKPNMIKEEIYQPLHSGKFIDKKPELVQTIPDYIKVRKLSKLTIEDKQAKEVKNQQAKQKFEQDKQKKEQDKTKAIKKLNDLGLTDDEINSLK